MVEDREAGKSFLETPSKVKVSKCWKIITKIGHDFDKFIIPSLKTNRYTSKHYKHGERGVKSVTGLKLKCPVPVSQFVKMSLIHYVHKELNELLLKYLQAPFKKGGLAAELFNSTAFP